MLTSGARDGPGVPVERVVGVGRRVAVARGVAVGRGVGVSRGVRVGPAVELGSGVGVAAGPTIVTSSTPRGHSRYPSLSPFADSRWPTIPTASYVAPIWKSSRLAPSEA